MSDDSTIGQASQVEKGDADGVGDSPDLDLSKTKSIADTLPLWREILFVAVISCCQFMTQAGLGQCLSILPTIGAHFGLTNPGDLSWLIAGYSLTVGTFILVAGRFGDLFGYKRMIVIGFAWFALWSLVAGCAYYSNHVLFVFARIFQGVGPAICLPNGLAVLGASYHPGPRKDMVFAVFGATAPAGAVIGAVFSGVFNLTFWPWTFWTFALVLVALAVATAVFVPDPPQRLVEECDGLTWRQTLLKLDPLGCVTGVTGLVLVNFAWNQAGVVTWPGEPYLWVTLILGVVCIAAFFVVEYRFTSSPLLPFDAFTGDVGFVLACVSSGWGCFGIWVYYLWNTFLNLRHATSIQAAAWTVPLIFSGASAAILTGFLLGKVRPAVVMLIAMVAFCVGTILIATMPVDQTYWAQTFVCTLIIPFGMDMSFPSATVLLSNSVKKEHQGIAASLVNTVVNYSISLALGFAGTVEYYEKDGDTLKGYRSALYLGIGLSSLGILTAIAFLLKSLRQERRERGSHNSGKA